MHAAAVPKPYYGYRYLGCYKDVRTDRAFPNKALLKNMTAYGCTTFAMNPPATYLDQKVKDERLALQGGGYMGLQFGERRAQWRCLHTLLW